jgi:hypothetical protein
MVSACFEAHYRRVSKYIVASLWLPETNVLRSQSNNVALVIHDAGSGTTCTNIDANVVIDVWVKLIARVCRHLSRLLP